MGKLFVAAFAGLLTLSSLLPVYAMVPSEPGFTPDMPPQLFDCSVPLIKLIASSNQSLVLAEKVPADKLEVNIESQDKGIQAIELFDTRHKPSADSPGVGHLGWVMYDTQSGKLLDNTADEQHPQELTFNPQFGQQYQQCLQKEQRCQAILSQMKLGPIMADSPKWLVVGKGRAYFHAAPTEQCIDENKFVIPGDATGVVGFAALEPVKGEKNDYLLVSYGNASGWINFNRLTSLDQVCQDAQAQATAFMAVSSQQKPNYQYQTNVQQARLYFYSAPNKACRDDSFVMKSDDVTINGAEYNGYVLSSYTNPNTGNQTEGWLEAKGLLKRVK